MTNSLDVNSIATQIHSLRSYMLIDLAIERGALANDILAETDISLAQLEKRSLHISLFQYSQLVENVNAVFPDTDFAIALGRRININTQGQAGIFLMSLNSFGEVLQRSIEFQGIMKVPHQSKLLVDGEKAVFTFLRDNKGIYDPSLWKFVTEHMLSSFVEMAEFLLQKKLPLISLQLTFPKPSYYNAIKDQFQCQINFDSAECSIVFPKQCLDLPIKTANPILAKQGETVFRALMDSIKNKQSITDRVKIHLQNLGANVPDFSASATALGLSERSLRRKLEREGNSFQYIIDQTRREKAENLLSHKEHSVEYVARYLGFNNASNFRRAFKKWTGKTPQSFRSS